MKNIISISLMMIYSAVGYTQIPQKGEYIKDDNLDKFVGTWEGSKENQTLVINLKKEKIYFKGLDFYKDVIIGWHVYKKNGQVIESSISYKGSGHDENTTIFADSFENILRITSFRDLSRERTSSGELKLINPNEAVLTLRFNEQVLIGKSPAKPSDPIPTPSEWIMKKVN